MYTHSRGVLGLSSNSEYEKQAGTGCTTEEFLLEFITIFLLQSTSPGTYCALFSRRRLLVDRFVVVSGFVEKPSSLERSGYQFDSDAVRTGEAKTGKKPREKARRGTPGRTCEGIQFPSSRGWRAAHTLPFGAVTPRELWSPNEWLGRAKRRITYFFFFFFARCALFQDVYKYENRTCLPTSPATRRRRRGPLVTRALDAVRHASLTRARTRKERDARTIDLGASSDRADRGSTDYETYLSECVFFLPL